MTTQERSAAILAELRNLNRHMAVLTPDPENADDLLDVADQCDRLAADLEREGLRGIAKGLRETAETGRRIERSIMDWLIEDAAAQISSARSRPRKE